MTEPPVGTPSDEPAPLDESSVPESAAATPQRPKPERLVFTGEGREYFRIWAVNIMLTVATLGVYSAWAKVRRQQYFARHTHLAGSSFDYHGRPLAILRGRIVGAALFGGYTLAGYVSPEALLVALAVIGAVLPWLLAKSFRFRAHNTSHRGLRFAFTGSAARAYWVFLGLPVLSLLSLFIMAPYWHRQMTDYVHDNAWFGQLRFTHHTPVTRFYATYLWAVLLTWTLAFAGLLFIFALAAVIIATTGQAGPGEVAPEGSPFAFLGVFMVAYLIGILVVQSFMAVRIQNAVWFHTHLGENRFVYRLQFLPLFAIKLTNLLGMIVTLGFFRPFAQVRLARYMTQAFTVVPSGSLDDFHAIEDPEVTAVGEEAAGFFDFDIAF